MSKNCNIRALIGGGSHLASEHVQHLVQLHNAVARAARELWVGKRTTYEKHVSATKYERGMLVEDVRKWLFVLQDCPGVRYSCIGISF